MNAKLSIEKITPKKASEMLQNVFGGQRKIRDHYVDSLVREMKEGRWRLSCDCILRVKGQIANGQHRLSAVEKSGISCEFIVMDTADNELYKVIDSGIKRTVGDVFTLCVNHNHVAATGSLILRYKIGSVSFAAVQGNRLLAGGRSSVIEFIQKHEQQILECVNFVMPLYRKMKIMNSTHAAALLFLGSEKYPEKSRKFIADVFSGDSKDNAAWDLRERCIKEQQMSRKLPPSAMFGLAIKAWKSYINGTRPDCLKISSDEQFPKI